jgi:hypothetical protein
MTTGSSLERPTSTSGGERHVRDRKIARCRTVPLNGDAVLTLRRTVFEDATIGAR